MRRPAAKLGRERRGMANGYKGARVRPFTILQRVHLIRIADKSIARELLRGLIWDRLKIWRRYAVAAATICFVTLQWGAGIAENWAKLLHALGLR